MKKKILREEAKKKMDWFFRKEDFDAEGVKKIKRLVMKHNIKLGGYRRLFCKKCFSKLKGEIRIKKNYKTIECAKCGERNKFRLI